MDMKQLEYHWDELGKIDPLEAILTHSDPAETPWTLEEFFATGERAIDMALDLVDSLGITCVRGKALDFGCGIGRLTQALARHFQEVEGIDIAPSMIALAKKYNRFGAKCRYRINTRSDLSIFSDDTFNLVYSVITLQHMKPRYARAYIREFIRVLAPGGILFFQIPCEPILFNSIGTINLSGLALRVFPKWLLDSTYRRLRYGRRPRAESYWIRKQEILSLLEGEKMRILDVQKTPGKVLLNIRYIATKM